MSIRILASLTLIALTITMPMSARAAPGEKWSVRTTRQAIVEALSALEAVDRLPPPKQKAAMNEFERRILQITGDINFQGPHGPLGEVLRKGVHGAKGALNSPAIASTEPQRERSFIAASHLATALFSSNPAHRKELILRQRDNIKKARATANYANFDTLSPSALGSALAPVHQTQATMDRKVAIQGEKLATQIFAKGLGKNRRMLAKNQLIHPAPKGWIAPSMRATQSIPAYRPTLKDRLYRGLRKAYTKIVSPRRVGR